MRLLLRTAAVCAVALASLTSAAEAADPADVSLAKEVDRYLETAPPDPKPNNSLHGSWKNGPRFESEDGSFQVKFDGRVMVDWCWTTSDDYGDNITADWVKFRRVRFAVSGHAYKNTIWKVQIDFNEEGPEFKDVFMGLRNISKLKLTFISGHEKEPMGFEFLTSSKYISFIERSTVTEAFNPGRNTGVSIGGIFMEKTLWVKTGIYKDVNDFGFQMEDGKYQWTTRVAWTGLVDKGTGRRLHLGVGFSLRDPNTDTDEFASGGAKRFRARPGIWKVDRLVNTDYLNTNQYILINFEVAFTIKSFHVAAEYYYVDVDGANGNPGGTFGGWYIELGWWITGEMKQYSTGSFAFTRAKLNHNFHDGGGGWGAWQVVFRYSSLDLNDGVIVGGEQVTYTAGVNWHWNPNTRIMFNYVYNDVSDSVANDGNLSAFVTRFQFDW